MSDIADDIIKTAESVYAKLGRGSRTDTDTLARALMGEREMAALKAEAVAEAMASESTAKLLREVARAIRAI